MEGYSLPKIRLERLRRPTSSPEIESYPVPFSGPTWDQEGSGSQPEKILEGVGKRNTKP